MDFSLTELQLAFSWLKPKLESAVKRIEIAGDVRTGKSNSAGLVLVAESNGYVAFSRACEAVASEGKLEGTRGSIGFQLKCSVNRLLPVTVHIAVSPTMDLVLGRVPGNFGALWLFHTGDRYFIGELFNYARLRRMKWSYPQGFSCEGELFSETEEEIFAALKLPYIEPANRQSGVIAMLATARNAA